MTAKQRIEEILDQQHDSVQAVLVASQALVNDPEAFNIDGLDALLKLRSRHIETISALDMERKSLTDQNGENGARPAHTALETALAELAGVDNLLQEIMRRRQVVIINSMASMRNRVNFDNLAESSHAARRVLDVVR